MRPLLLCLFTAVLSGLAGCDSATDLTETERINQWFEARFEEQLAFSPIAKTRLGIKDDDYARIDEMSDAAADEVLTWRLDSTAEMRASFDYDALSEDAKISYDMWAFMTERAAAAARFRRQNYVFSQMRSVHSSIPQLMVAFHRVDTVADMDAYITRIGEAARAIEQSIDRSRVASELGIRPPRFAFDIVTREATGLISGTPFDDSGVDSTLWADARTKIAGLVDRGSIDQAEADALSAAVEAALLERWQPAYRTLIAWQQEDVANAVDVGVGVGSLPGGASYYAERLASQTTTSLTPNEIHEIGLANVQRIHREMEPVIRQLGFDGELREFFELQRNADDPRFFYPNTDGARQTYIDTATRMIDNIKSQLPEYFGLLPKADVVVKRVEAFREQDGAAAHYVLGAADGSRPGTYYAHLSDMSAIAKTKLEVIAYHEAIPGHHMQVSIAQELEAMPRFRRYARFPAFSEGWGLYAERFAKEIPGTYQTPESEFGRLTSELWRAVRLVVDTGIHAKGWDEHQALDYALANSAEAATKARSEVWRYIVTPGQATSYMIGMLKILELRDKAERELGARFDIRAFHDTILGSGPMPLGMLERRIDQWIGRDKGNRD